MNGKFTMGKIEQFRINSPTTSAEGPQFVKDRVLIWSPGGETPRLKTILAF
jgi:hypothetical protein